jgi:hypothetical protein
MAYFWVTVAHFAVCGGVYLKSWELTYRGLSTFLGSWFTQYIWWIFILFAVMLAPPLFLLYNVLRYANGNGTPWRSLKKLLLSDKTFNIPLVFIILSILVYISLRIVEMSFILIYGGGMPCLGSENFNLTVPFALNCVYLENLPNVIENLKRSIPNSNSFLTKSTAAIPLVQSQKGVKLGSRPESRR